MKKIILLTLLIGLGCGKSNNSVNQAPQGSGFPTSSRFDFSITNIPYESYNMFDTTHNGIDKKVNDTSQNLLNYSASFIASNNQLHEATWSIFDTLGYHELLFDSSTYIPHESTNASNLLRFYKITDTTYRVTIKASDGYGYYTNYSSARGSSSDVHSLFFELNSVFIPLEIKDSFVINMSEIPLLSELDSLAYKFTSFSEDLATDGRSQNSILGKKLPLQSNSKIQIRFFK